MNLKRQTKKAIPYSIGISLFNILVALFGMVYLVRYLDGHEYGILAILTGLPLLFNLFISLGYDAYIIRYVPNIKDEREVGDIIWRIAFQRMLLALLISGALVAAFDLYAERFELKEYYLPFVIYQLVVVFHIGYTNLINGFNARFLQKYVLLFGVIHQTIRIVAIIYGVYNGQDFQFFIIAFTVAMAISILLASIVFAKKFGAPRLSSILKARKENEEERSYRRISYVNSMGTSFLGTDIDRYILGYFSTNLQVAVYAIATKVLKQIMFFYPHQMFRSVLEPAFYNKYDASSKDSDLNQMFQFIFNANSVVGFLFIAIFYPLGKELLQVVFNQEYVLEAYWPLLVFLLFIIFYAIPLGLVAKAIKRPKILLYSKLSVIVNLVLGIPFAYYYGALGMAVATSLSVVLKNVIIFTLCSRHVTISIPWKSTIRSLLNAIVTLAGIYYLDTQLEVHLILKILAGGLIYMGLLKINPVFDKTQKTLFISLMPNKLQPMGRALL